MDQETTRRGFLHGGALATAGLLATAAASAQEKSQKPTSDPHQAHKDGGKPADNKQATESHAHEMQHGQGAVGSANDRGKLVSGRRGANEPPVPIEAPDLTNLFWEMKQGVKEFHLHCRHTRREFLPDMWFDVWGFNDSMPGPTIEVVEGDRVRIVVHNELPEMTSMHWHGLEVPIAMDGVHGLTQEPIPPGKTFVYEFDLHQNGTFFYHSHGPMQEAIGMVGLFIIHPKKAYAPVVDRDFGLIIQEFAILPGSSVPNTMSMEFNFFTINGRSGPYGTPMVVRQGDRVRLRMVNFSTIDHHPMHIHGLTFWVTGTEAGRIPESAWIPGNNVLIGVAQARDVEFVANNPGDWMIHCHMFHHMMNHMTSMVGPMLSHTDRGLPAGLEMQPSLGMLTRGPALSEAHGPALGRGLGEQTSPERAVRNGGFAGMPAQEGHAGHGVANGKSKQKVPGYPQDMMGMQMLDKHQIEKLKKPETAGMRSNWYEGVEGLMTVIRVLPSDLYDKVMAGKPVPDGASVPDAAPAGGGQHMQHGGHGS